MQIPKKRPKKKLDTVKIDELQICAEEACVIIKGEMKNRFENLKNFSLLAVVDPRQFKMHKEKYPDEYIFALKINYPMIKIEKLKSEFYIVYNNDLFSNFLNINELYKFIIESKLEGALSEMIKLIEIVLVTPISTADAKGSSSNSHSMRIKTHIRNTISQDLFSAFSILSIQKNFIQQISLFNKKVIDKFASMKDRREEYFYK